MYKILVIEDDFNLRKNICEILSVEEYEVECAENGISGLHKAQNVLPDLIISDIMMPEMNGFEVLDNLMKDPETASIPFLFLTAKAEPENVRKGMKTGADDYLIKPFNIDDLLAAIQVRLKKKEINDQKIKLMQDQISLKVPHELRTPLVPILGYAELMHDEDDITQIREMAKIIRKSGKTLHNRIEKFLLYKDLIIKENDHSLTEKDNEPTLFSYNLTASIISELSKELKPERIKINVESCSIPMNEKYLGTVILELTENSLKYSGEDDQIILHGCKEGNYVITVTDPGRGMDEKEINDISAFRKFGENRFSETGLGLGLSIVRKIADLYNCKFLITSEKNRYTSCVISIPL